MRSKPFSRAAAMMALIAAAMNSGMSAASVGEYVSRGHGQNKHTGKGRGNTGTNWLAHLNGNTNGRRECERRMRQMGLVSQKAKA